MTAAGSANNELHGALDPDWPHQRVHDNEHKARLVIETQRPASWAGGAARPGAALKADQPHAAARNAEATEVDAAPDAWSRERAQAWRAHQPQVSPWRVVAVQLAVGLVGAAMMWLVARDAGWSWSVLYGAAVVVVPNALLARGMTRGTRGAVAAAAGFLFWEMLKIGVSIVMLVIAAKAVPQLSWPVLLVTLVVCMKVNWFALLWRGR